MVLGNPMEEMLLSQAMHDKQVTARKRRRAGTGGPCPCLDLESRSAPRERLTMVD